MLLRISESVCIDVLDASSSGAIACRVEITSSMGVSFFESEDSFASSKSRSRVSSCSNLIMESMVSAATRGLGMV